MLFRSFNDFDQAPAFVFAERARFGDPNFIADLAIILLIVRQEFLGLLHEFPIDRVPQLSLNSNCDGLIHLIASHYPDSRFSEISF